MLRVLIFGVLWLAACGLAVAGTRDVVFPKGYLTDFLNYLSLDRANGQETARLFADPEAVVQAQLRGEFPVGARLVMEVSGVKKGKDGRPLKSQLGRLISFGRKAVFVMKKVLRRRDGTASDGWEFAAFDTKGRFLEKDYDKCRTCHEAQRAFRHVFSYEHLEKAALNDLTDRLASPKNFDEQRLLKRTILRFPDRPKGKSEERFRVNRKIQSVISSQLAAIRSGKSGEAFSYAAPAVRANFKDAGHFLEVIRSSFPILQDADRALFPKLRDVPGGRFLQELTLVNGKGEAFLVHYAMVRVAERWKVAGCEVFRQQPLNKNNQR